MIHTAGKTRSKIFAPFFMTSIFAFLYLPMVVLIAFSFNSRSFPAPWHSFTLQWYSQLFSEKELWGAFFNSMIVALSSSSLCILFTIFLLYFLSRGGRINRAMNLFYINLVFPETVLGVALISYFTLLNIPLGLITITIAHTIVGLGFTVPIAFLRYREINPAIFEASKVLGAHETQTFFKITLPLMRPILLTFGLMIFIVSFDDFILSYFCSGAGTQTLSLFLVSSIRYGVSPVVNALATILLIMTFVLASLFLRIGKRDGRMI